MFGIPVWMSSKPIAWYLIISSGILIPKGMIGNASNCLMLLRSIISIVVTTLTALAICCALVVAAVVLVFTLAVGAGVDVAGLVVCGALEPPELVGDASTLLSACVVAGVEALGTTDVGEAVTVFVVAAAGEDTTLVGLRGLTGLAGDCTLVGFVTDLTHVFEVVIHTPDQIGEPYGSGHVDV